MNDFAYLSSDEIGSLATIGLEEIFAEFIDNTTSDN